jgi:hypothetical protein
MPKVVAVHGIAQQLAGPETLAKDWRPALRDGMRIAGAPSRALPKNAEIEIAFFGDLFRRPGQKGVHDMLYGIEDIGAGIEEDLLVEWWNAAVNQGDVLRPEATTKIWAPGYAQQALSTLMRIRFFSSISERVMVGHLKQVSRYFDEATIRKLAKERLLDLILDDTKVVIGHSLGSVVAYEALCEPAARHVQMFITIGSPLGLRNPIFRKLKPPPVDGVGTWPPAANAWTNIAATQDPVAAVKELAPLFAGRIIDKCIDNETRAHDVVPYLTARETGEAIIAGLSGSL